MSEPSDLIVPTRPTAELKLFAKDGESMKRSQESLTTWCRGKIEETRQEWHDAKEITATALHAGFRVDTHRRAAARVEKRLQMFEKMLVAFEAGFMLVPNMDCDVFAIRTDKTKPTPKTADWQSGISDELMGTLPAGEGQYINPSQTVESEKYEKKNHKGELTTETRWRTVDFEDGIDFPAIMAHPEVMTAAQAAMALNVFDGIGVCPPSHRGRKGDPLLLGMIRKPGSSSSRMNTTVERVTFLIAWFVDVRTI